VTFVLDNSVAMRWCFENAAHPYADGILNRLAAGEDALVPVLWVLRGERRAGARANPGHPRRAEGGSVHCKLKALRVVADAESAARVFSDMHRLALDHRLTSYDAAYLELALRHGLPLATLDDKLIRASKAAGSQCFCRTCVKGAEGRFWKITTCNPISMLLLAYTRIGW